MCSQEKILGAVKFGRDWAIPINNEDMKNVFGIIDSGMQEITGLAAKYFQPAEANQPALTQNVVNAIEMK